MRRWVSFGSGRFQIIIAGLAGRRALTSGPDALAFLKVRVSLTALPPLTPAPACQRACASAARKDLAHLRTQPQRAAGRNCSRMKSSDALMMFGTV